MCWAHLQNRFWMQKAYFNCPVSFLFVVWLISHEKLGFKNLIIKHGYSEKVANELWKWYNFSEKRGVASF